MALEDLDMEALKSVLRRVNQYLALSSSAVTFVFRFGRRYGLKASRNTPLLGA